MLIIFEIFKSKCLWKTKIPWFILIEKNLRLRIRMISICIQGEKFTCNICGKEIVGKHRFKVHTSRKKSVRIMTDIFFMAMNKKIMF